MSINSMLSIGKDSLTLNQYALTVVSDNIANVNTEGYSKQTVHQAAKDCNIPVKGSKLNVTLTTMGAEIASISRYTNSYIDTQLRDATTDSSFYTTMQDGAEVIENLLNELDGSEGLTNAFNEFYSSLNDLTSNPSDLATRSVVAEKAEKITQLFNEYSKTLTTEQENAVGVSSNVESIYNSVAASDVTEINSLVEQIANINVNIAILNTSSGTSTSLLDKRTQLLEELSQYIPVEYSENNSNYTCTITLGGETLMSGTTVYNKLAVDVNTYEDPITGIDKIVEDSPLKINLVDVNDSSKVKDVTSKITNGSLGATLQLGQGTEGLSYQNVVAQLDTLASTFANSYNEIQTYVDQASGKAALSIELDAEGNKILKAPTVDGSGNLVSSNSPIFDTSDGSGTITAANICLNSNIKSNPYGIATAIGDVDTTTGEVLNDKAVGDTQALLQMTALRNTTHTELAGNTFDNFMIQLTTNLGVEVSTIQSFNDTKQSALEQIAETKSSLSGVNLDEELVDLIKYQRSYEASARIFNVASELMETMVNLGL